MSRLEDLFLGRERVVTLIDGSKLKVRQWPGTDFCIAPDGSFVMPRWQGKEEGETPHQRRQKKWRAKELKYVVYSQGLPAALRSRQLALFQAQVVSCPTYQAALSVFAEEVREGIIIKGTMDPQKISLALRHKLQAFGFVFQRAQKTGVKETMVKILFLYQDEAAGLNVGAMLARTVAITDRLRERLLDFYSWVRKYSAQEIVLRAIQSMVDGAIEEAVGQMKSLRRSSAMMRGSGDREAQRLIADQLTTMSMRLEPLKAIQPFSRWISFVMEDLKAASQAIKKQDFILVRAMVERILFSVELKKVQKSLDRLLLRLGQDSIVKRPAWNSYEVWAADLGGRLRDLTTKEEQVGLREKVCRSAALALFMAAEEADKMRRLKHFKEAVKRAYVLL